MNYFIYSFLLIGILYNSSACYAQRLIADTTFLAKAKQNAKETYYSSIKSQSRLYNGSDYALYQSREDEHPYFLNNDWVNGSVVYDNDLYEHVPLMFDISSNKVITEHILNGSAIELITKKIEYFSIGKHGFVSLEKKDGSKMAEGFYELLYNGKTKVYAKHEKTRQEFIRSYELFAQFNERNRFYILKNGTYFSVKSKASVLKVLSEKKQEIRRFVSTSKLSFTDPAVSIAKIAAFYDIQKN